MIFELYKFSALLSGTYIAHASAKQGFQVSFMFTFCFVSWFWVSFFSTECASSEARTPQMWAVHLRLDHSRRGAKNTLFNVLEVICAYVLEVICACVHVKNSSICISRVFTFCLAQTTTSQALTMYARGSFIIDMM